MALTQQYLNSHGLTGALSRMRQGLYGGLSPREVAGLREALHSSLSEANGDRRSRRLQRDLKKALEGYDRYSRKVLTPNPNYVKRIMETLSVRRILGVLALVLVVVLVYRWFASEPLPDDAASSVAGTPTVALSVEDQVLEEHFRTGQARRSVGSERAEVLVKQYAQQIDNDPENPETPARLNAAGNLYRQKLQDYASAARCYESIVVDYPDWEGAAGVFTQLITCYEQLGEEEDLEWLCKLMLRRFPEDSQEYAFAQSKLGYTP